MNIKYRKTIRILFYLHFLVLSVIATLAFYHYKQPMSTRMIIVIILGYATEVAITHLVGFYDFLNNWVRGAKSGNSIESNKKSQPIRKLSLIISVFISPCALLIAIVTKNNSIIPIGVFLSLISKT